MRRESGLLLLGSSKEENVAVLFQVSRLRERNRGRRRERERERGKARDKLERMREGRKRQAKMQFPSYA